MNGTTAVRKLRERGYRVELQGRRLVVCGPADLPPERRATVQRWLEEHAAELHAVLVAETNPAVQGVLDVFPGARLVDVRSARLASGRRSEGKAQH